MTVRRAVAVAVAGGDCGKWVLRQLMAIACCGRGGQWRLLRLWVVTVNGFGWAPSMMNEDCRDE